MRTKQILKAPKKAPMTFEQFANEQHACRWFKRTVSEGAKGPIEYEFTRLQVTLAKDGLPWKRVWLIVKRSLGDDPKYWYSDLPNKRGGGIIRGGVQIGIFQIGLLRGGICNKRGGVAN